MDQQKQQRIDELGMRIGHRMEVVTQSKRQQIQRLESQLRALGPLAVLERGYSITQTADGGIVRDSVLLQSGQALRLTFARGSAEAEVKSAMAPEK